MEEWGVLSASEDLILHDVDKPKLIKKVTERDAPENYGASEMEIDDASKKKSQKSKGDEDASSDLDTELDAWSAKRLALVEKKANSTKQKEATMKEFFPSMNSYLVRDLEIIGSIAYPRPAVRPSGRMTMELVTLLQEDTRGAPWM